MLMSIRSCEDLANLRNDLKVELFPMNEVYQIGVLKYDDGVPEMPRSTVSGALVDGYMLKLFACHLQICTIYLD